MGLPEPGSRSSASADTTSARTEIHIDLVQFHEIIHDGAPQTIVDLVLEAAVKARDAGKIRFIGFTGHRYPYLFCQMLAYDFRWDTVQFPANLLDAHFRSFTGTILPQLKERGIGAIGMKSLEVARTWKPMPANQISALLEQITPYAGDGHLERYKAV